VTFGGEGLTSDVTGRAEDKDLWRRHDVGVQWGSEDGYETIAWEVLALRGWWCRWMRWC
jgi:hypothetical protein